MNYHEIYTDDMLNGSGLRVVLFLSGCDHYCVGCQNPQTHDFKGGNVFSEESKKELFVQLSKDYISGVTFTGGDPLHTNNLPEVLNIVNEIRLSYPKKTIWLYTGYYWEEVFEPSFEEQSEDWIKNYLQECEIRKKIISMCDVVVDGRYIDKLRDTNYPWAGSTNQRVIDVQKTLIRNEVVLWA